MYYRDSTGLQSDEPMARTADGTGFLQHLVYYSAVIVTERLATADDDFFFNGDFHAAERDFQIDDGHGVSCFIHRPILVDAVDMVVVGHFEGILLYADEPTNHLLTTY